MRLIDADELIRGRVENDNVRIAAICAPTAYDADKVIEQIENESKKYDEYAKNETAMTLYHRGVSAGFRFSTEIVRAGGVNE